MKTKISESVAFMFSPQASHYLGMGEDLYHMFPTFAKTIVACEVIYYQLQGKSLEEGIWKNAETEDEADVCGPGIFAVEVAIAELLKEFGVSPSLVFGHSFGEYGAAVCAGVMSLEEGMRLVLERAKLVKLKVKEGRLTALKASVEKVKKLIDTFQASHDFWIDVAAVNAPQSVVVGGSLPAIEEFELFCKSDGKVEFLRLSASAPFAYHTRDMDIILEELGVVAGSIKHTPLTTTFISCSTGEELKDGDFSAKYWTGLTRNTIQFAKAIRNIPPSVKILVEIGPSPKLQNLVLRNFESSQTPPILLYTMEGEEKNSETLLRCLCQLTLEGVKVNWDPWYQRQRYETVSLLTPTPVMKHFKICANGKTFDDLALRSFLPDEKIDEFEVEVEVIAASLNYRDKFFIFNYERNENENETCLGFDVAGIVTRVGRRVETFQIGDEVYGVAVKGGSLASHVRISEIYLMKKPRDLSFESASTLPLTYLIAWKALVRYGNISSKDRVFVNLGAGWIGIALAHIALHFGSEVFALVGSQERREYLKKIGVKHIYDLGTMDFGEKILKDTSGKGLTLVVNSFDVAKLKEVSLGFCGNGGKFVDICNEANWAPEYVHSIRLDVDYAVVDLSKETSEEVASMWKALTPNFENDAFPPIPFKKFPVDVIGKVFHWFHTGKFEMSKPVIVLPKFSCQEKINSI